MPSLELRFDFASPDSYLAATRIDDAACDAGVEVSWRPFLLGPIFADRGWSTSPFTLYPDKGRYMVLDVACEAAHLGVPYRHPSRFPVHSVLASRVALLASEEGEDVGSRFARAAFEAHVVDDRDLAEPDVIDAIARPLGLGGPALRERAIAPSNETRLRARVERARELGIFGAPTFVVGRELFWGNDRLERALEHAGCA